MHEKETIEYTNRKKMEETTVKVLARLHHMKSMLCKTIKSKSGRLLLRAAVSNRDFSCFRNA
jgi:hypothetical protein